MRSENQQTASSLAFDEDDPIHTDSESDHEELTSVASRTALSSQEEAETDSEEAGSQNHAATWSLPDRTVLVGDSATVDKGTLEQIAVADG